MSERQELLDQANDLSLEFHSNIPTDKLKVLIENELNKDPAKQEKSVDEKQVNPNLRPRLNKRQRIVKAKQRALKMQVVTITNKDNRENDMMTTVSLSFENEFFGISRSVPLDVAVEIETALVEIAEGTMMTLHKDEIVNGRRTGNKTAVSVKKFAVSYAKQD